MNLPWEDIGRFIVHESGTLTYSGLERPVCKVCNKDIQLNDQCVPFPSFTLVKGIAHKYCILFKN